MSDAHTSYAIRIVSPLREDLENPRFWRHKHPRLQRRYERVLELLTQDPYGAARSEQLRHDFAGLRSAVLLDQWRLIFKVCEECLRNQMQESNPLDCCRNEIELPDRTVNIIDISNHYA